MTDNNSEALTLLASAQKIHDEMIQKGNDEYNAKIKEADEYSESLRQEADEYAEKIRSTAVSDAENLKKDIEKEIVELKEEKKLLLKKFDDEQKERIVESQNVILELQSFEANYRKELQKMVDKSAELLFVEYLDNEQSLVENNDETLTHDDENETIEK